MICAVLILCMAFSLCACGGSTYGVRELEVLVEQEYSLAFRNDDSTYNYVTAAIETLNAEGTVGDLTGKWFGSSIIDFKKDAKALEKVGMPEPRTFITAWTSTPSPWPMSWTGNYWGFDVQLAMAVCERLGWTLQIQPIEKENVYVELSSGNIDCAWGGIALDQKEVEAGKYTQYGPYVSNNIVVAGRNGSIVWNKLKLGGRTMAMCSTEESMAALETRPEASKAPRADNPPCGWNAGVLRVSVLRQVRCCAYGQHGALLL